MSFGRLGALGRGFGSLGAVLGSASGSPALPTAPVLAMDPLWTTADATPDFQIDAAWVDQDDLQFEVQVAGGDWSGATVTHHTVITSEISGTRIIFGFSSLSNANYEARCKFKHSGGSYSLYSNQPGAVPVSFTIAAGTAPVNTVAPAISGNLQVGQTLTTTNGTWTGTATIVFTYQWKRAGSNIASATASTYVLVEADAGQAITCVVTGTNGIGNSTGTSNSLTIDVYVVFLTTVVDATDATTYSAGVWNGVSFGVAAANRKIALGVESRGAANQVVSSASIGGQSATSVVHATSSTVGSTADFVIADVPTGTTGNISITWDGARTRCGTGVWAIYGAGSSTPTATATSQASPAVQSLAIPAKGVGLACGICQDSTSTAAWTNMTERYDAVLESARHTGADNSSTAGVTQNVTLTWTPNVVNLNATAYAAWGP